jgi:alpha-1,3-mannosyltransferase
MHNAVRLAGNLERLRTLRARLRNDRGRSQMIIVHIVRQFHPSVGGLESVVGALAAAQRSAGHNVRIVTLNRLFNAKSKLAPRQLVDGVEVIRVPFWGSSRYPLAFSAINFIRDADIVHVHAIDFFFDYLAWTKPFHRKKLIVSTHGGFFHTRYAARFKRLYFHTVTRLSVRRYDRVVAVSDADRELFGKIRKDVVCIENGANVSCYKAASSATPNKAILALGRFASHKRLDRLISFVGALRRRDPRWTLTIAGRPWGVEYDDLIACAKRQQVRDAIQIVVAPDDRALRGLMAGCSVIASASEHEGFGLSAVEGMAAGLFPLLNDIPAFRQLLAGAKVGMLIDFSQPEAAAHAFIEKWAAIEADYRYYRRQSIEAASAYDWPRVCKSYLAEYDQICGVTMRTMLGVPISVNTDLPTMDLLDSRFEHGEQTVVAFANAHTLNVACQDEDFRTALCKSLVLNDGVGVDIASLLLFGKPFPQNLNGTDFVPFYLARTRHRFRIFLLGGHPGIAERASAHFTRQYRQHQIAGWQHGYFGGEDEAKIVAAIQRAKADVVLVALGNPRQELWLTRNLGATGARLGFAVGGLFDFVAEKSHRAPKWIRSARLEWAFRLLQEPVRLSRRYLVGNPLFVLRIMGQRFFRPQARFG